jgi:hypothetical protein
MARWHWLPVHRQAGDVLVRQGPVAAARPGRRADRLGLRSQRRPGQCQGGSSSKASSISITKSPCSPCAPSMKAASCRLISANRSATFRCRRLRRILAAAAMSPVALQKSRDIAARRHRQPRRARHFRRRAVRQGRQVWFSEVSPRPHDTGLVTLCSQRFSEFELHARAILGLPVDTACANPAPRR